MSRRLVASPPACRTSQHPTSVPRLSASHNGRTQDRVDRTSWQGVPLGNVECTAVVPLGDVECTAAVPLGDAEWHGRYALRALLHRYVSRYVSLREKLSSHAPHRTCPTGCAIMGHRFAQRQAAQKQMSSHLGGNLADRKSVV